MALALGMWLVGGAAAQVTTERSASILVFPKVIANGDFDTIIQITNTSNSMVHAHCFYVNGALTFPELDPGPLNPPLWTEIDFDIWLTKQQPTHWIVSEGRLVDPSDEPCSNATATFDCGGAGLDPGRVPPVVGDFTGELKCIEVDASGAPLSGNHLKGEATLVALPVGDELAAGKYNAIGVIGLEANDGNETLCLGGGNDACPAAEYSSCPQTWILNHLAEGAVDPVIGVDVCDTSISACTITGDSCSVDADCAGASSVSTDITVVPCTENFETQVPTSVTIQFSITNEYEQTFSASTTVTCWAEVNLAEINEVFLRSSVNTDLLQTRMRPASGTSSGFMVVVDSTHTHPSGSIDLTAANLHVEGTRATPDVIVIPADQLSDP